MSCRKWDFPDFSDKCPICGGEDCAVRFSFYFRTCRNIDGQCLDVPVARYRCRRPKHTSPELDRTFSLLPSCLIPYKQVHISLMESILYMWLITEGSINDVLDNISDTFTREWYPSGIFLYRIRSLFSQSVIKLNQASSFCKALHKGNEMISLGNFLQVLRCYKYTVADTVIPGGEGLGLSYYFHHGGWEAESHFLFGTPSQHRVRHRM